ncbi:hypothetical protein D3C77_135050 [compost metagenome]
MQQALAGFIWQVGLAQQQTEDQRQVTVIGKQPRRFLQQQPQWQLPVRRQGLELARLGRGVVFEHALEQLAGRLVFELELAAAKLRHDLGQVITALHCMLQQVITRILAVILCFGRRRLALGRQLPAQPCLRGTPAQMG